MVAAGRPAGRHADLGEFRRGLGHRRGQAAQAQGCARAQGALRPDRRPQGGRLDARRRLHLERHDLGRESAERRLDRRRPRGPGDLRRHLGGVRHGPAVAQARCRDLVLAEGDGRRGRARHAGALAARRPAAGELLAAVADAEALPHDLGRQVLRSDLQGRHHQHALDALRRGCDRRPALGRERRRAARA